MTLPTWVDPKFSVGNIITIITMIVGLIAGWNTVASQVKANQESIIAITKRVDTQDARIERIMGEVQSDRLSQTNLLTELRTDMRYLRAAVDDIRSVR